MKQFITPLAGLISLAAAGTCHAAKPLFSEITERTQPEFITPDATARCRCVDFDPSSIDSLKLGKPHNFHVSAFDDRSFGIVLDWMEPYGASSKIWKGHAANTPGSRVIAVSHKGLVTLKVAFLDKPAVYLQPVSGTGGGLHYIVREVDDTVGGTCGCENPADSGVAEEPKPSIRNRAPRGTSPTHTYVDVAIFYTDTASWFAFPTNPSTGASVVESRLIMHHSDANDAHKDSDTKCRLRIVHMSEVTYNEAGGDPRDHRDRFMTPGDGIMDGVQAIRDDVGADFMALFFAFNSGGSGNTLGIARFPTQTFPGYSVTKWDSDGTYVHELGHNFGCRHQASSDPSGTAYAHAHEAVATWVDPIFGGETVEKRQTLMWNTSGSTVLNRFSNPSQTIVLDGGSILRPDQTVPLGNSANGNNARYLRENRSTAADLRQPVFFVDPSAIDKITIGGNTIDTAEASQSSPEDDLPDILSDWHVTTEAEAGAEARLKAGSYPAITINKPLTITKWNGSGNVVIGN